MHGPNNVDTHLPTLISGIVECLNCQQQRMMLRLQMAQFFKETDSTFEG